MRDELFKYKNIFSFDHWRAFSADNAQIWQFITKIMIKLYHYINTHNS